MEILRPDLCVIGAGSGGLSVAAGAAQMGANVVLIENHKMGGDCLNYGCVPSKAVIAAARAAAIIEDSAKFGVDASKPTTNYQRLKQHVQDVIATIAPNDSVERFESLGVKVIKGSPSFYDSKTLAVNELLIKPRRFVIATGSSAAIPAIPGLDDTPYLTNETIFDLEEAPRHLIVIGGGPIGCEMAQAHLMLGTKVTLLEAFSIMPKDDPEAVALVRDKFIVAGLDLHEGIKVLKVEAINDGVAITIEINSEEFVIQGSHLLVAAGRKPNLSSLKLEKANIDFTARGIDVDARLRSSNKKVFAIGDCVGSFQFTHAAAYHAGIVIRNALFHLPAKTDYSAMPWVTYTTPELAQVGLNEPLAKENNISYKVIKWPFSENDRAIAEKDTSGFIKVLTSPKGVILGATIVGHKAGELITPWILAVAKKMKIKDMANIIIPYPTLSEVSKRVAGKYFMPTITSPKVKKIVKWLQKF